MSINRIRERFGILSTTEKRKREEEEEFSREVIAYNSNMEKNNKELYNAFKSYYNPSSFRTYSVLILYHSLDRLETMRDQKKFKELKEHLEQAMRDIETLIETSGIDELSEGQRIDVITKQIGALNKEVVVEEKDEQKEEEEGGVVVEEKDEQEEEEEGGEGEKADVEAPNDKMMKYINELIRVNAERAAAERAAAERAAAFAELPFAAGGGKRKKKQKKTRHKKTQHKKTRHKKTRHKKTRHKK